MKIPAILRALLNCIFSSVYCIPNTSRSGHLQVAFLAEGAFGAVMKVSCNRPLQNCIGCEGVGKEYIYSGVSPVT